MKPHYKELASDLKNTFRNSASSITQYYHLGKQSLRTGPDRKEGLKQAVGYGLEIAVTATFCTPVQVFHDVLQCASSATEQHPRISRAVDIVGEANNDAYIAVMENFWKLRRAFGLVPKAVPPMPRTPSGPLIDKTEETRAKLAKIPRNP